MGVGRTTPIELHMAKKMILSDLSFVSSFRDVQTLAIVYCENCMCLHTLEADSCFKRRKYYFSTEQKCREPLSYYHFGTSLDHVQRYLDFLKSHNIKWIWLRFHFPIMWCPLEEENDFWAIMQSKCGFLESKESRHLVLGCTNLYLESSPFVSSYLCSTYSNDQ